MIRADEVNWGFMNYSVFTSATAFYPHAHEGDYFELNYLILGLGGEAGEAVDVWKKLSRMMDPDDAIVLDNIQYSAVWGTHAEDLLYEIGDVVWYISHLLRALNVRLDELTMMNTYKLWKRHQNAEWPFDIPEHEVIARITSIINRVKGHTDATYSDA